MRELYIAFSNSIFSRGRHINHFLKHWKYQRIWPDLWQRLSFCLIPWLWPSETGGQGHSPCLQGIAAILLSFEGVLRLGEGTEGQSNYCAPYLRMVSRQRKPSQKMRYVT